MKVKPKLSYKLLGTDIKLNKNKTYNYITAINQPDYKKEGKIFILENGTEENSFGFLLNKNEYEVINANADKV